MPTLLDRMIAASLPAMPKPLVRLVSRRYLAGVRSEQALALAEELGREGFRITMDILGEHCTERTQADAATAEYMALMRAQAARGVDRNISIKLTQFGLKLDREYCLENTRHLARLGAELGTKLRIDMEDSSCTDDTIWIYRNIRKEYPASGLVLQAKLRRTLADVRAMAPLVTDYRLCKGIYLESEEIAFRGYEEINRNYLLVLEAMLAGGSFVGIATHDENLLPGILEILERLGIARDRYEFQMLLGVKEKLQRRLLAEGYGVRIYLPYGRDWYAYSLRRLKENPTIAGHVLRAMFSRA